MYSSLKMPSDTKYFAFNWTTICYRNEMSKFSVKQ